MLTELRVITYNTELMINGYVPNGYRTLCREYEIANPHCSLPIYHRDVIISQSCANPPQPLGLSAYSHLSLRRIIPFESTNDLSLYDCIDPQISGIKMGVESCEDSGELKFYLDYHGEPCESDNASKRGGRLQYQSGLRIEIAHDYEEISGFLLIGGEYAQIDELVNPAELNEIYTQFGFDTQSIPYFEFKQTHKGYEVMIIDGDRPVLINIPRDILSINSLMNLYQNIDMHPFQRVGIEVSQ